MTDKYQCQQQNTTKAISNEIFKKKQLELASTLSKIDDNKLGTPDISNTEVHTKGKEVWFRTENANEANLDIKKE